MQANYKAEKLLLKPPLRQTGCILIDLRPVGKAPIFLAVRSFPSIKAA